MYLQIASVGAKLSIVDPHPIFRVEKDYPSSEIIMVLSDEPDNEFTPSVKEHIKELNDIYKKRGIQSRELYLVMEQFWENVATLVVEILKTDKPVLLNLSTGRRVFISTLLLAGSFALSLQPEKSIICVQTSRGYPAVVVFEPIPPVIPDAFDWFILKQIKENKRVTTGGIAKDLRKVQSTVSVRLKKLVESKYVKVEGHKKELLPKGKAILRSLNELIETKKLDFIDDIDIHKKKHKKIK